MRVQANLDDLADEAAAGDEIRRYLGARGIKTVPTLALVANDQGELERILIAPLLAGWSHADAVIKVNDREGTDGTYAQWPWIS